MTQEVTMGARGPAPARSDQRRRRNKPETEVEQVEVEGTVDTLAADEEWHPVATSWFHSLSNSGQSRFFEPSDWHTAYFCASLISSCMSADTPSAQLVAQVRSIMADLLTTEGARRRAGIELVRKISDTPTKNTDSTVATLADRRKRLADAS